MSRFVYRVTVKGKKPAVSVFEIYDAQTQQSIELKQETATEFQMGRELYFEQNILKRKIYSRRFAKTLLKIS